MFKTQIYAYLALLTLLTFNAVECKLWWETASFYQIYPRSFKDSDGDGVGDLNGITEQLTYLKEIGITATWLSPIFTSPMADFGYDIANFTEIDPTFGTLEDFEQLLAKAKTLGIKIILDFVPNHSSDECEWFIKSVARDPEYEDFYVWHSGKPVEGQERPDPPTNWISVFRGSMWTWNEQRQQYYLHQFLAKQPDLNYHNPAVVSKMKDVLRYWLRMGVAGFRVDAVPHMFEIPADENGNWPDEPRNENVDNPEDYNYLQHIYTVDQPETIDMVYQFREVLNEVHAELGGDEPILMTEAYSPLPVLMQYYGNDTMDGAQIPFNFLLISNLNINSTAYEYEQLINSWLEAMPANRAANWVLGNHDQMRIGSRLGEQRIDLINTMLLTLPGCSVNYMGEEIGMTDVWISWNDTVDPQACQSTPEEFERLSRDPVRTPFQWNDEAMAGFTTGNTTWLPVADDYRSVNVKRQRGITNSHLNIFKQLMSLRQETTMKDGNGVSLALNENVLAIKREVPDSADIFVVLLNLNDNVEFIDLNAQISDVSSVMQYEFVSNQSPKRKGDRTFSNAIILMPQEAIVLGNTNL